MVFVDLKKSGFRLYRDNTGRKYARISGVLTLISHSTVCHSNWRRESNWRHLAARNGCADRFECRIQRDVYADEDGPSVVFVVGNDVDLGRSGAVVLQETKYELGASVFQQDWKENVRVTLLCFVYTELLKVHPHWLTPPLERWQAAPSIFLQDTVMD